MGHLRVSSGCESLPKGKSTGGVGNGTQKVPAGRVCVFDSLY